MAGLKHSLDGFVLNLAGAGIRRTSLRRANLTDANFENADCSFVDFRGANMLRTKLKGTILIGADLTDVRNLTREQLSEAIIDKATKLPSYLSNMKPQAAE